MNCEPIYTQELRIQFPIGYGRFTFNPQPDITPYEAARISELFLYLAAAHAKTMPVNGEAYERFCRKHGLLRHFEEKS